MFYEFCPSYVPVKREKKSDAVLPPQHESYFDI